MTLAELGEALRSRGTDLTAKLVDGTFTVTMICPLLPQALQAVAADLDVAVETALRMVDRGLERYAADVRRRGAAS